MTTPDARFSAAPAPPAPGVRLRWPDVAKGASILLVVLHHVVLKHYVDLVEPAFEPVEDAWRGLTYALKPIRMPLFFAVSGFFAASAVTRPWSALRRRVTSSYYLYVVWLSVFIVIYSLERDIPANRVQGVADFIGELFWAASSLWFLYALAVYVVIARALRALPPQLVVGAAAVLAMSVSWLGIEENNRYSVLAHLVYFLAGAYYPHLMRQVAAVRATVPVVVALLATYGLAVTAVFVSELPRSLTSFGASVIGVTLGIVLAVMVAGTALGAGLAWIGRRTLRIYVLHLAVLVVLVQIPIGLPDGGLLGLLLTLTYPVLLSGVVVLATFGVHSALVWAGLGWLFEAPSWLVERGTGQPGAKVPSEARSGISA